MIHKDWKKENRSRAYNIVYNNMITLIKFNINEGNTFNLENWKIFIV